MELIEILKKLKATYKDKGLSEKVLEVFAKRLLNTADEEIDQAITDLEPDISLQQMMNDQIRTLRTENEKLRTQLTEKGPEPKPEPTPEPDPAKPEPEPNEPPAWAKTLIDTVTELKAEKQRTSTSERLAKKFKELEINETYFKPFISGQTFESEEQFENYVEGVKQNYEALMTEFTHKKAEEGSGARFTQSANNGKEGISDMMKTYLKVKENESNKQN